jgi:hypothetical protein
MDEVELVPAVLADRVAPMGRGVFSLLPAPVLVLLLPRRLLEVLDLDDCPLRGQAARRAGAKRQKSQSHKSGPN